MLAGFQLRDAVARDVPALATLKRDTFRETFLEDFAIPYPPADLALFEAETYGEPRVAAELADPAHKSWVVEHAGALVAYAHCGPCKLPYADAGPGEMELYQIYARRDAQGAGLGRALLAQSLAYMRADTTRVWLGVWSGNARAQAVYARMGFVAMGEYRFKVGDWYDEEFIYARPPAPLG